jgi:hypothetical protein
MSNNKPQTALESLQARFAILDLSGQIVLIDREQIQSYFSDCYTGTLSMYKRIDAQLVMKRHLESIPVPSNTDQVIKEFWSSPSTTVYNSIAFSPIKELDSTLNLWKGPTAQAKRGKWVVIRNHIRDVICNGEPNAFDYLVNFLAHMVQKPEEKPGIFVVLLGGQGTGKGMFFNLLHEIFSKTTLLVSDVDRVIGRFNAQLERNYIVCMDEALFVGDKKAIDRLKSVITESTITIEEKYQPSRSIRSYHRLFAASNYDHFANVEKDDRRFLFLKVSEAHKQDIIYFKTLFDAINDPATIGALLYYLLRKDISNFEVRRKPKTEEAANQKLQSLDGFERYWYEVLLAETFHLELAKNDFTTAYPQWTKPCFISTDELIWHYRSFDKNAQRHKTTQEKQIKKQLLRLCPSAKPYRKFVNNVFGEPDQQKRGLNLPDIATARREFCEVMGCTVDWD